MGKALRKIKRERAKSTSPLNPKWIISGGNGMSDKERLQEIKESWISDGHLTKIDREHFDWLIEQVEKAEELVQSLNDAAEMAEQFLNDKHFYMDELKKTEQQLQQAQAKIERYEKALENILISPFPLDIDDAVAIAKQALEGEK